MLTDLETRVSSSETRAQQVLKGDPARAGKIARRLLNKAKEARRDPKKFLEFVLVEERTHERMTCAAHQEVVFDFLQAHVRGVLMMPRGHAKTFTLAAFLLWLIGNDPSFRGAIVSETQQQAEKVLALVRDYIQDPLLSGGRLQLVFPDLRPTQKKHEPWTQTRITIDRPSGTRDATLMAVGLYGAILGSRLKCVVVDDILSQENVMTEESRRKVIDWVDASVLGTLDKKGDRRAYFVGTAWHPLDMLHQATLRGWATLKMDVVGNVDVYPDDDPLNCPDHPDGWEHPALRAGASFPHNRLVLHDPDPRDQTMLWPESFGCAIGDLDAQAAALKKLRREHHPHIFAQMYMMVAHDLSTAWCRPEWIEACQKKAREMGVHKLADRWPQGECLVFMGVDLGIGIGEQNDDTSFFIFAVLPTGHRRILWVEYGKYDGATKVNKVIELVARYGVDLCIVESNGGQKLLAEWALDRNVALPVKAVQTDARKAHPEDGLPGLFLEIYNVAWLIPNEEVDGHIVVPEPLERFISECVNYVPDKHTGDVLMSGWLAQGGARSWGVATGSQVASTLDQVAGDFMDR